MASLYFPQLQGSIWCKFCHQKLMTCLACILLRQWPWSWVWSQIKCLSWVQLYSVSTPVGFVSYVLELLSSGRMSDRKWKRPESLVGYRQPLPLPTHAKPCQLTVQPRPPWEKQSSTSSGKWGLGTDFPCCGLWLTSRVRTRCPCLEMWSHSQVPALQGGCIKKARSNVVECLAKVDTAMYWGQRVQKLQGVSDVQNRKRIGDEDPDVPWLLIKIWWKTKVEMSERKKC